MPTIGITDYYRYLGLSMTAGPDHPRALSRLSAHLEQLDHAPLKPQQRMYFLRVHVLPGLNHLLVLDPTTISRLERLDKLVRRYVRKWLRIPHDTPNTFIHGLSHEGGLGVPSLRLQIPLLRRDRLDRLVGRATTGLDPVLTALLSSEHLRDELKRWGSPQTYAGVVVSSKAVVRATIANRLHTTVDGRGLRFHNLVPSVSDWVTGGTSLQSGSSYIHCVQTRAASLHTAVRAARGHLAASMSCDACGELEGLYHIVQRYCRKARPRERGLDGIVNYVEKALRHQGYQVLVEPSIPTPAGVRKPDIVVYSPGAWAKVLDVSISAGKRREEL